MPRPGRRITDEMLRAARVRRDAGETMADIARSMGVTGSGLAQALNNRMGVPRRRRLPDNWTNSKPYSVYMTKDQLALLRTISKRNNISIAALVHEAVARYLRGEPDS